MKKRLKKKLFKKNSVLILQKENAKPVNISLEKITSDAGTIAFTYKKK